MKFKGGTCDVQVSDKVISCVRKQGENTVRFLSAVKPSRHSTVSTCSSAIWPTLCSNLISENIHINGTPGLLPHIKNLRITRLTRLCAGQTWFLGPCPPCEISWECMYCIHDRHPAERKEESRGGNENWKLSKHFPSIVEKQTNLFNQNRTKHSKRKGITQR